MQEFNKAKELLKQFKQDKYYFGQGILDRAVKTAAKMGRKAIIFRGSFPGSDKYIDLIADLLKKSGTSVASIFKGAKPNSPKEDVFRMRDAIDDVNPDYIITFGGGSNIDAAKAALVLHTFSGNLEDYYGMGKVFSTMKKEGRGLLPHIAMQTIAGSGSHLTKYSNITDTATSQKKLIIDDAIIPDLSIFEYSVTYDTPIGITSDGAFDGFAHLIEVLYGSEGKPEFKKVSEIASAGIELIVKYLPEVIDSPGDSTARNALCYGTDLGGYAIMVGGTNGGHLTSFSLVDILSHGRACAIMDPYYSVFFAPEITDSLRIVGNILKKYGHSRTDFESISGRQLGLAVASSMIGFAEKIGFPTTLNEVDGFSTMHIERALKAAKDPDLKSKLENMPVPFTPGMIDTYMKKVLESAASGDLNIIENVKI